MSTVAAVRPTTHIARIIPIEDAESWLHYAERHEFSTEEYFVATGVRKRRLHNNWVEDENRVMERIDSEADDRKKALKKKNKKKNKKNRESIQANPGVREDTIHGMMVDAGSTGSRLHVYEFEPRDLHNDHEVDEAVSGMKLSFPGTETRWTERLSPGLGTFASLPDDELVPVSLVLVTFRCICQLRIASGLKPKYVQCFVI